MTALSFLWALTAGGCGGVANEGYYSMTNVSLEGTCGGEKETQAAWEKNDHANPMRVEIDRETMDLSDLYSDVMYRCDLSGSKFSCDEAVLQDVAPDRTLTSTIEAQGRWQDDETFDVTFAISYACDGLDCTAAACERTWKQSGLYAASLEDDYYDCRTDSGAGCGPTVQLE